MADTKIEAQRGEEHADLILRLDRQQSIQNPNAIVCPVDPDHGRLGVHSGGTWLMCGKRMANGHPCPAQVAAQVLDMDGTARKMLVGA